MEEHPAVAVVSSMTLLLDDAGDLPVFALAGPDLDMLIESELTLISRLGAHLATAVEQAAGTDRPADLAAPSMVAWLRGRFGLTPPSAHRLVREVAALRAAPVAAEAARYGAIGLEAAAAIGHAVAALPDEVGPELRCEGAAVLLGFAVGDHGSALDANELQVVGRHLHEVIDPDAADLLLAQRLEREEAEVHRRRFLSITDDHVSGGVRLRGLLTAEAGGTLRAVLGPLTALRPVTPSEGPSPASEAPESPPPDERSGGQRLVDALQEACAMLLAGGELPTSGGDRPQLLVTVDHAQLAAGLGVGTLPDGHQLAPAALRRLACDAEIIPAILGTASQPLDVGRSARTATRAQRKALLLRDKGCAFPGCDRPPAWCEAHHIVEWKSLGRTDLGNLVLLCAHHHRVIHRDDWIVEPADAGLRPLFTPPAWIDPYRRPRRNLQHHIRDILRTPPAT